MSLTPKTPIPEGAIRFNTDSNKMEVWIGDKWMQVAVSSPNLDGGARGLFGGGFVAPGADVDVIQFVTISTTGNATDFGDLTGVRRGLGACASSTRAVFGGGIGPSVTNVLDFVAISSTGDAQDFGDLVTALRQKAGLSNATRGIFSGGYTPTPSTSFKDEIDHITIASTGDAKDFGNLGAVRSGQGNCSNPTRGLFVGGTSPSGNFNVIEFVTISTLGNAQDFGDLAEVGGGRGVCSNSIKGVFGGGYSPSNLSGIQQINIATLGNSFLFGDLIAANKTLTALSSSTRAVFGGGLSDVIQFVVFATDGDAVDFGDLLASNQQLSGASNGHGGL